MNLHLQIGTFAIPCAMRKVTDKQDVKLGRASQSGNKIKRQEIDVETGEIVTTEDVQRGVWEGEKFRSIPAEAIDAIMAETTPDDDNTFSLDCFIPVKDIPFSRATAAYYIGPKKDGPKKPLALLHKALAKTKRAGVFKVVLTSRQHLAVVYAQNGGLMVNLLSYAGDFSRAARASEALEGVEVDKRELDMAVQLVEVLSDEATVLDSYEDDLVALKAKLVEEALAGRTIKVRGPKEPTPAADGDALMAALRASVADADKRKSSSGKKAAAAA